MTGKYWDRPLSLVDGCTPCSPGCDHCWSMAMGKRFHRWPEVIEQRFDRLEIPVKVKKPTVFSIWNDLFHEGVNIIFIEAALQTILATSYSHTFLVLTKRPARAKLCLESIATYPGWGDLLPLNNLWLGVTVCNNDELWKIEELLKTPAAHRWVSIEPMLGPVDLTNVGVVIDHYIDVQHKYNEAEYRGFPDLDAVILGGETGPGARPMHPDWVRSVRDQCLTAGVPFFFKQWGECPGRQSPELTDQYMSTRPCVMLLYDCVQVGTFRVGRTNAGRLLDGREHNDLPWRPAQL